jgi:DNA-binding LacI/PurR family transcriptional regulator
MTTPPASPPERRPSIRLIAEHLGLSFSAVARSLRQDPRISAATRERVQAVAAELGYRPDPQVAKLMRHLQSRRKPSFTSTLFGLTSITQDKQAPYHKKLFASLEARAEALGHRFELLRFPSPDHSSAALSRILRARGIEGLLLLPLEPSCDVSSLLDWQHFSVVAATYSALQPEFHRVVPYHFGNTLQLCRRLAGLGYRRIGLVLNEAQDVRVHHGYTAAVMWQNVYGGTEPVRPLIFAQEEPHADEVRHWFAQERPDAIVATGCPHCEAIAHHLGLRIPGPVAFAAANNEGSDQFAGIDERPEEVGRAAVSLLHAKIMLGDRGVPAVPTCAMISGVWMSGHSAPPVIGG